MSEAISDALIAIILFVGIGLLLMILCYQLKKSFSVPTSPALLISGLILRAVGPYIGDLSTMVSELELIDEETITLVFFPILIFEASFSVDWYTIRKEIVQILTLATSVVIGCTLLTAVVLKYVFSYDYTWSELLLLGVIMSATDHIAVDALLDDIYASDQLETLIGGETMFNEATVLVLFKVLLAGPSLSSFGNSVVLFVRLSFGGFAIGIGFAMGCGILIKRMLNDFFLETNTALVIAYLLFWICEKTTIEVSGALALVSYGLFMSAYGKTLISPSVEEQLKHVLELLSSNIESLVFIIAGLLLGNSVMSSGMLDTKDLYSLFLLFPLTYLIRFVVLVIHFPVLKYAGYGLNWRELIALNFAGMKGVISTSLALIASNSASLTDDHFKTLVVYFGIGTAGLSIVFGGLATRIAVRYLGLESLSDVQENMLVGVTSALVEESEKKIENLLNEKELKLINWDLVLHIAGPTSLVKSILKKSETGLQVLHENPNKEAKELLSTFLSKFHLSKEVLSTEMRRRYLTTLKSIYWEKFEEGLCHGETSLILIDSCNICLDYENEPMKDWTITRNLVYNDSLIKFYSKFSTFPVLGKFMRKLLYFAIILAYDSANNFIKGHEETEKLIDEMEIDIDKEVFEEVMLEAHAQVRMCEEFMKKYIIDCYPEVLAEVQTKRCCKVLLYKQRKMIQEIHEDGLIQEVEFNDLMQAVDLSIKEVTYSGIPSMPLLRDILSSRFTSANSEEINRLISMITEKKYEPGTLIYSEGEPANGAYYILRGRVDESSSWITQELIIGNILGVQHLLEEFSHTNTSTAKTVTSSILAHIPREAINIEGLIVDMYSEAIQELILLNRARYNLLDIKEKYILRVLDQSEVKIFKKGKTHTFIDGGLVMKGKVYEKLKGWVIKPSRKPRLIHEDCIVIVFPVDFTFVFDKNKSLSEAFTRFCIKVMNNGPHRSFLPDASNLSDINADDSYILLNKTTDNPTAALLKANDLGIMKFKTIVPHND